MQSNGQYAVTETDLLAYEKKRDKSVRRGKRVSRLTTGLLVLVLIGVIGGLGYLLSQAWNTMSSIADGSANSAQSDAAPTTGSTDASSAAAGTAADTGNTAPQPTATAVAPAVDTQPPAAPPAVEQNPPQTEEQAQPALQLEYHVNTENDATHYYPDYLYERAIDLPATGGGSWHVNHFYIVSAPGEPERGYVITSSGDRIDVDAGSFAMSRGGTPCYVHSPEEVANRGLDYHWYVLDASGAEVAVY